MGEHTAAQVGIVNCLVDRLVGSVQTTGRTANNTASDVVPNIMMSVESSREFCVCLLVQSERLVCVYR